MIWKKIFSIKDDVLGFYTHALAYYWKISTGFIIPPLDGSNNTFKLH